MCSVLFQKSNRLSYAQVESNDIALLNDEFQRTIQDLGALVIEKILQHLEELGIAKVCSLSHPSLRRRPLQSLSIM